MRGGPIDLTPYGAVLTGIGILYWLLMLVGVGLALWWPKRRWLKIGCAVAVLVGFIYPVAISVKEDQEKQKAAKARLEAAMAHFAMRCKSAGEKIHRTVENVEGIVLLKNRTSIASSDQFLMNDPYGGTCSGDECLDSYLFSYRMLPAAPGKDAGLKPTISRLYKFVDLYEGRDGSHWRYTKETSRSPLVKRQSNEPVPRYGVTWADISTKEDREHWVAGGAIKVVDMRTDEVIAERIGFVVDRGQGSTEGFRTPWTWARSYGPTCPPISEHNAAFVVKVLKPVKQGE